MVSLNICRQGADGFPHVTPVEGLTLQTIECLLNPAVQMFFPVRLDPFAAAEFATELPPKSR